MPCFSMRNFTGVGFTCFTLSASVCCFSSVCGALLASLYVTQVKQVKQAKQVKVTQVKQVKVLCCVTLLQCVMLYLSMLYLSAVCCT